LVLFPQSHYAMIGRLPGSVLLETSRFDPENSQSFLFLNPLRSLSLDTLAGIPELFRQIEECLREGWFVAGFMAYECGFHFEPEACKLPLQLAPLPLAWFGAYRHPYVFDHVSGRFSPELPPNCLELADPELDSSGFSISDCRLAISREEYCARVERVRQYIAAGDTYQVNFTSKLKFDFRGRPEACFAALRERQHVPYAAFLRLDGRHILSLSPELFFRVRNGRITSRPMKGTAPRGVSLEDDLRVREWLHRDIKNRSENVMIVDLMRNDVGKVALTGSVRVDDLFAVEKYETLFQMTSTVSATLRPQTTPYDIFRALFPCGSITGAPKVRTMQIVQELETEPRGVYTGTIGFFSPGGDAVFNVAIRTLVIDGHRGEMGAGGGIVYDSVPAEEHAECLLKAQFFTRPPVRFQLLESLLWQDSYYLLELHLERLRSSAEYFDFPWEEKRIRQALDQAQCRLSADSAYKVRLLLDRAGEVTVESAPLRPPLASLPSEGTITLATARTSSTDRFLYHKTTHREFYERCYAEAARQGHEDVVFLNERDEVTEGSRNNLFVELAGRLFTPPVECGLLPGIMRRHLLETDPHAGERKLKVDDLRAAEAIYLCNSVRGMRKVRLVESPEPALV
jgi:para-aminobenzoate synthetase/4-amino-4-deoxychorismate lyase